MENKDTKTKGKWNKAKSFVKEKSSDLGKKVWKSAKKNKLYIIGGTIVGAYLLNRILFPNPNFSYEENVDGWNLEYNEYSSKNVMSAQRKGYEYELIDNEKQKSVDWDSNYPKDFSYDKLEKITLETPNGEKYIFVKKDLSQKTLSGEKGQILFSEWDLKYNQLRGTIRDKIRENFAKTLDKAIEQVKQ